MTRRAVLVALAGLALTLVPASAMAYPPPGLSSTLKDATPGPGVPFTVHASGARSNEVVTLTMTRNPTSAGNAGVWRVIKSANAGGVVDFPVALAVDGVWVLVSTGSTGAVLGTQKVTVAEHGNVILGDASAGSDTAAGAGANAGGGAGSDTATGSDTAASAGAAAGAGGDTAAGAGPAAGVVLGKGSDAGAARAGTGASGGAVAGGTATAGQLSRTGFQGMGLAMGGGFLVLLGAGAVLVARRGRWAQPPP